MTPDDALACARWLASLTGGGAVRRLAAHRALSERSPQDGAELLHHVVTEANRGVAVARVALAALGAALGDESAALAAPLREAAEEAGLDNVVALFSSSPARQDLDARVAAKRDALKVDLSLGHLKWKARLTRSPDELARFATTSDPAVIRNVLLNPRLTEDVVVRVAARRPTRPEVLLEVWRSSRWNARQAVRRALAFNPYLPPAVGTRILPLLGQPDWRAVARDGSLHEELREQAERLLAQPPELGRRAEDSDEREGVTSTRSAPRDAFLKE